MSRIQENLQHYAQNWQLESQMHKLQLKSQSTSNSSILLSKQDIKQGLIASQPKKFTSSAIYQQQQFRNVFVEQTAQNIKKRPFSQIHTSLVNEKERDIQMKSRIFQNDSDQQPKKCTQIYMKEQKDNKIKDQQLNQFEVNELSQSEQKNSNDSKQSSLHCSVLNSQSVFSVGSRGYQFESSKSSNQNKQLSEQEVNNEQDKSNERKYSQQRGLIEQLGEIKEMSKKESKSANIVISFENNQEDKK